MSKIESRYTDGTYLAENPEWDRNDSLWKASLVHALLASRQIVPASICEVGCGAGDILVHLKKGLPKVSMTGFDVSPQVADFWKAHQAAGAAVEFRLGDFHAINKQKYDQ